MGASEQPFRTIFIRRSVLISFFLHSLVLCAAALPVTHVPLKERIFMVKIETEQAARPAVERGQGAAAGKEAREEKKNIKRPGLLRRVDEQINPPPESRRDPGTVRNTQETETTAEQPSGVSAVQESGIASDGGQGLPSGAVEGFFGGGGVARGSMGASLYGAGSGSASARGSGGGEENYLRRIQELIERTKIYPHLARKRKQEGTVVVQFTMDSKGLPREIRIMRSAGFALLDTAAREIITKAAPFPYVKGAIEVPITFRLSEEN
ncbi:MAG TPA: energy transducer TonB [Thermodesulfovibrionales bacterium]|nr:energy transducer TonB [Thermodesulfovibrionales bacterium]